MDKEEELKRRIADSYDPDALVDVLKISSEDIVEQYWDRVRENMSEFFYVQDDMNIPIDNEEEWFDDE